MKKHNPIASEWYKLGESDFDYAKFSFQSNNFYHFVCFHCQQAVEKYLKGWLTDNKISFPKTHDLVELVGLFPANIKKEFDADQLDKLDSFYIESRYTGSAFEYYTKADAQEALDIADKIIVKIKDIF